ncbi:hypothetical protein JWZ98_13115 [Methylomonas sp. EFPC1]|uniref:hypothetical protein n=1 Tax=Methylomonas sp. EFPC1 TaxID=2812647 RepID=UPI00196799A0|nr:hypothetical protein [Methylomonas sp. EFPC1]QSA99629.1 hypothetical protein JWZ98_13115 [Methylomonas sp. EFPC1]
MKNICDIQIEDCVHYRGFRYGGFGSNIYEDYIISLLAGEDISTIKKEFVFRVLLYNGSDFGSALGLTLDRVYRPWLFPWLFAPYYISHNYYFDLYNAYDNPDIICHFSFDGVLASHINREFVFLERALEKISEGYQPDAYGYVTVAKMMLGSQVRYLVLDGNHRISALHALGYKTVRARVLGAWLARRSLMYIWPGVITNYFAIEDALKIFDRYFYENNIPFPERPFRNIIFDEPFDFEFTEDFV